MVRASFVVDRRMAQRSIPTGQSHLCVAAAAVGHDVFVSDYVVGSDRPQDDMPFWADRPVLYFGPHQGVVQALASNPQWHPGGWPSGPGHAYSGFSPHLGDLMLNSDRKTVTVAEFLEMPSRTLAGLFARPDAGTKGFDGTLLSEDRLRTGSVTMRRIRLMAAGDAIVLAPARRILGEARFVVVDGEVVAGSTYRWGGRLDVRSDVLPECLALAREVAGRDWQAAGAYGCDVALVDADGRDEVRLLELSPLSSMGLYACDTRAVAVAAAGLAARSFRASAAATARRG